MNVRSMYLLLLFHATCADSHAGAYLLYMRVPGCFMLGPRSWRMPLGWRWTYATV